MGGKREKLEILSVYSEGTTIKLPDERIVSAVPIVLDTGLTTSEAASLYVNPNNGEGTIYAADGRPILTDIPQSEINKILQNIKPEYKEPGKESIAYKILLSGSMTLYTYENNYYLYDEKTSSFRDPKTLNILVTKTEEYGEVRWECPLQLGCKPFSNPSFPTPGDSAIPPVPASLTAGTYGMVDCTYYGKNIASCCDKQAPGCTNRDKYIAFNGKEWIEISEDEARREVNKK